MPLASGTRVGPYAVVAPIGAGGMGEVYRARDSKLKRDVALKVLPENFAVDPDRMARFQREAEVLASLNHPNIAQIYGLEERALVMELVEGEMLKGPMPLETALEYARQIADALQAAHEKGIVHRDLKPGNIMITPGGLVKVLDFGLAAVAHPAVQDTADPANSPTLTLRATQAGVIMGTAAYMSPEQARGKPVDKRADIWAFGVVLYEMLTGTRIFEGATISDTLAAVLTAEPPWDRVPPKVRRLLRACLQKNPKQRLHDIADAALLLEDAAPATAPRRAEPRTVPWVVAAVAVLCLVVALWAPWRKPPAAAGPVRFQIALPNQVRHAPSGSMALSPDGRRLAFAGTQSDGVTRLWVRDLDALEARPLIGTETPHFVAPFFWSPDSRFIAFDPGRKLKKVDVSSGAVTTICDLPAVAVGGSWNRDGVIIMGNSAGGLLRVPVAGGVPLPLTTLDPSRQEYNHTRPAFFPDGKHFAYARNVAAREQVGTYIGSLDAKPDEQSSRKLMAGGFVPDIVPPSGSQPGWLLFYREGNVLAQPFDANRLQLTGEPAAVAENIGVVMSYAFFSTSTNGVMVCRPGGTQSSRLTWFDRNGTRLGTAGDENGGHLSLALSPDGTRVAAAIMRSDQYRTPLNLWLVDLTRPASARFTFSRLPDTNPVWSRDGSQIVFSSLRNGAMDLYQKRVSGAGEEEVLLHSDDSKTATSWSRDGRFLLYEVMDQTTRNDLWVLPMQGERKPAKFLSTPFNETQGQFSPDGGRVAYTSDESGRNEVYVRTFPQAEGKQIISQGGGHSPRWRGDGKELFYLSADGKLMAAEVGGAPKALFEPPRGFGAWDAASDGKRFVFAAPLDQNAQAPFTVVLNWPAALKR